MDCCYLYFMYHERMLCSYLKALTICPWCHWSWRLPRWFRSLVGTASFPSRKFPHEGPEFVGTTIRTILLPLKSKAVKGSWRLQRGRMQWSWMPSKSFRLTDWLTYELEWNRLQATEDDQTTFTSLRETIEVERLYFGSEIFFPLRDFLLCFQLQIFHRLLHDEQL